jgi:hypothetical protein
MAVETVTITLKVFQNNELELTFVSDMTVHGERTTDKTTVRISKIFTSHLIWEMG